MEARAAKDRKFKAMQRDIGMLLDEEGDEEVDKELAPNTPQKVVASLPVAKFPQKHVVGALGK